MKPLARIETTKLVKLCESGNTMLYIDKISLGLIRNHKIVKLVLIILSDTNTLLIVLPMSALRIIISSIIFTFRSIKMYSLSNLNSYVTSVITKRGMRLMQQNDNFKLKKKAR